MKLTNTERMAAGYKETPETSEWLKEVWGERKLAADCIAFVRNIAERYDYAHIKREHNPDMYALAARIKEQSS